MQVLQTAMGMIQALDCLDAALLSSVDTSLEPVSVLNDIQHSSLKMLRRALRNTPDELLGNLDWKKWVGGLRVKGKYKLLQKLDADAPDVQKTLVQLEEDYKSAPPGLFGHKMPIVSDVMDALDNVARARAALPGQLVQIQTELGDIYIPETELMSGDLELLPADQHVTNSGIEVFKVKYPDMLGSAQWTVLRNNRSIRIDMLHAGWLDANHRREHQIQPGDSLKCKFQEVIGYDKNDNEVERKLAIIEVLAVISPPVQQPLNL